MLLLATYCALLVSGSLYPLSQWQDARAFDPAFLWAPWPETITRTDLITNYFVYMPLGVFAARAFFRHRFTLNHWLMVCAFGAGLSLVMECMQLFVPQRVASNVDIVEYAGHSVRCGDIALFSAAAFTGWRRAGIGRPGWIINAGLCGLWLLSQVSLQAPALVAGGLHLGFLPYWEPASLHQFKPITALIFALEIASLGLFISVLLRPERRVLGGVMLLTLAAILLKFAAAAMLVKFSVLARLLSLEALLGLGIGTSAMLALLYFRAGHSPYPLVAGVLCAFILAKLFHGVPFMTATGVTPDLATKPQALLNITGVAYLVAEAWPYLALVAQWRCGTIAPITDISGAQCAVADERRAPIRLAVVGDADKAQRHSGYCTITMAAMTKQYSAAYRAINSHAPAKCERSLLSKNCNAENTWPYLTITCSVPK